MGPGKSFADGEPEGVLARKVVVERRLGDADVFGNLAHGDAVNARCGKAGFRGVEDSFPGVARTGFFQFVCFHDASFYSLFEDFLPVLLTNRSVSEF